MSTLWTPDGDIQVGDDPIGTSTPNQSDDGTPNGTLKDPLSEANSIDLDDLSPEERGRAEKAISELAKTREKLLEIPAETVVANHAMGLYELAALHLAHQPPNFSEAKVAIDALGALLDGMAGRLGMPEPTLREGLEQIRIAFVKLKQASNERTSKEQASTSKERTSGSESAE